MISSSGLTVDITIDEKGEVLPAKIRNSRFIAIKNEDIYKQIFWSLNLKVNF